MWVVVQLYEDDFSVSEVFGPFPTEDAANRWVQAKDFPEGSIHINEVKRPT